VARGAPVIDRIERARRLLPSLEVEALLVTSRTNVRYLTGFESSNAWLLVDPERTLLFTDGRYLEAASAVDGVEAVAAERNLPADLATRLPALTGGPVGFEADHVTVSVRDRLAESGVELRPTKKTVEDLRAVKDWTELDAIRRSTALLMEAFEQLARERVIGRTEAELAWLVERTIRELGAEAVSFAPIVASGPNAARPHHHPGARVIDTGELLLVDAGAVVDGYCSDCTRTFATGPLDGQLTRAYEACLDAQTRSLEATRVGMQYRAVDAVARAALVEHGYEVLHSLGHSLGLDVHEDPRLTRESEGTLRAGNVVTIEPGVYLPGVGGVRIEDLVVVRDEGPQVLTTFTKELVSLA
jgi:Xaa-Pro aminopeptidase